MENDQLLTFLNNTEIPVIKKKPKTFLGIAKQPHYENVISNIYAFFFNVHEEHCMKDLFIRSLIECIQESERKDKDFSFFTDFDIETEYGTKGIGLTKKKGRIDILLFNSEQAIIIENKVHHHLDNDLDDYWNSVKLETENVNSKIGIILSLKPISEDQYGQYESKNEYINITHSDFMKKVMANASSYLQETSEHLKNHQFYLTDFYQNIMNISTPTMNEKEISFFTENKEKINQLVSFKYHYRAYVISRVEEAGRALNNVKIEKPKHKSNARRLRYFRSLKHSDLLYTVVFGGLFEEEGVLHIIVEPRGQTLREGRKFENIGFNENEKKILKSDFCTKTNEPWAHFASKSYHPTTAEIANLSGFIQNKLVEDHFIGVFEKLEAFLLLERQGESINN